MLNFSDAEDRVDPQTRKILDACPNIDSTELSELRTHLIPSKDKNIYTRLLA